MPPRKKPVPKLDYNWDEKFMSEHPELLEDDYPRPSPPPGASWTKADWDPRFDSPYDQDIRRGPWLWSMNRGDLNVKYVPEEAAPADPAPVPADPLPPTPPEMNVIDLDPQSLDDFEPTPVELRYIDLMPPPPSPQLVHSRPPSPEIIFVPDSPPAVAQEAGVKHDAPEDDAVPDVQDEEILYFRQPFRRDDIPITIPESRLAPLQVFGRRSEPPFGINLTQMPSGYDDPLPDGFGTYKSEFEASLLAKTGALTLDEFHDHLRPLPRYSNFRRLESLWEEFPLNAIYTISAPNEMRHQVKLFKAITCTGFLQVLQCHHLDGERVSARSADDPLFKLDSEQFLIYRLYAENQMFAGYWNTWQDYFYAVHQPYMTGANRNGRMLIISELLLVFHLFWGYAERYIRFPDMDAADPRLRDVRDKPGFVRANVVEEMRSFFQVVGAVQQTAAMRQRLPLIARKWPFTAMIVDLLVRSGYDLVQLVPEWPKMDPELSLAMTNQLLTRQFLKDHGIPMQYKVTPRQ